MASFITCTYPSKVLSTNITFHMLLPKRRLTIFEEEHWEREEFPVLYLLHGAFEDGLTIVHNSNISTLVDKYNIAVILPYLGNSFYINNAHDFIVNELMPYSCKYFSLSSKRENTYISGISMGGYGAFYNGLRRPDLFSKIISISGALDISFAATFVKNCGGAVPECLNKKDEKRKYELENYIKEGLEQKYYLSCGKQDVLTFVNEKFVKLLSDRGIPCVYEEREGNHDWKFWSEELERAFEWLV